VKRGRAARQRVKETLYQTGSACGDTRLAERMTSREMRCGDPKLVKLLTKWRDAERRADVLFDAIDESKTRASEGRNEARFYRSEERADIAWCALRNYVEVTP
jgi:hypothetical protein